MTPPVTTEALVEARTLVRHSLKVGAPGLSETAREAVLRSIMLKLEGKVLAPLLAAHQQVTAERDEARADLKAAEDSNDALNEKLSALAPHGSCACSYDKPGDVCMHHSPALATATSELARLRAEGEGTVAVPLEPTVGMQEDGLAALEAAIRTHGKPSLPGFAAAHVYRAMVAARPSTAKEDQADA